ncbi:MAG TPA: AtpZ/AtpI family protein, partial [Candidatus Acidoferrales bacterium]|nr:AtpZ/AtpI family protein [Candidatus Acidoferrales bacterium]
MASNSPGRNFSSVAKQIAIAMQIPFSLMVPVFAGGGIGFLLDHWLHTKFLFTIALGLAGFGIGIHEVFKLAGAADTKANTKNDH